jgi:fused signal recognition particle receptor
LFSKFKEKLSGFKEALASKLQEKSASQPVPEALPAEAEEPEEEFEAQEEAAVAPEKNKENKNNKGKAKSESGRLLPFGKSSGKSREKQAASAEVAPATSREDKAKNGKPNNKSKFSFLDKAKSLVFDQEIVIDEKDLEDPMWALEMALLESDVALPVAEEIVKNVKEELVGQKKKLTANTGDVAEEALRSALLKMLSKNSFDFDEFVAKAERPVKILFVGVNGTGKTTSIAKVTKYLQDHGYSVVLAAGDTFRAGAIEQLEVHANALGVKIVKHKTGGDPAAVIFDAIEYAKSHNKDVVLADTAGRLHTNINLMDQMRKIVRVTKPDMLIFVDEAIAGNDAVERARLFNESVAIDGTILTKTDADAKGGSAISIAYITGKPVLFLGVGQTYPDIVKFEPEWLVDRLLGGEEAAA